MVHIYSRLLNIAHRYCAFPFFIACTLSATCSSCSSSRSLITLSFSCLATRCLPALGLPSVDSVRVWTWSQGSARLVLGDILTISVLSHSDNCSVICPSLPAVFSSSDLLHSRQLSSAAESRQPNTRFQDSSRHRCRTATHSTAIHTCHPSSHCSCEPNLTHRHNSHNVCSRTTSWASIVYASWQRAYCSPLSNGPEMYGIRIVFA